MASLTCLWWPSWPQQCSCSLQVTGGLLVVIGDRGSRQRLCQTKHPQTLLQIKHPLILNRKQHWYRVSQKNSPSQIFYSCKVPFVHVCISLSAAGLPWTGYTMGQFMAFHISVEMWSAKGFTHLIVMAIWLYITNTPQSLNLHAVAISQAVVIPDGSVLPNK